MGVNSKIWRIRGDNGLTDLRLCSQKEEQDLAQARGICFHDPVGISIMEPSTQTCEDGGEARGGIKRKSSVQITKKRVRFATALEQVYEFELPEVDQHGGDKKFHGTAGSNSGIPTTTSVRRTSEMTFLSSTHGRARRELRDIDIFDLQTAVKYGVKTPGHRCPKTKHPRWKYTFGNIVYITDHTSTVEVTSYKQAISIARAVITPEMQERHQQDRLALQQDPHLCATHAIIIIDQSGSMRTCDVKGFKSRSQAAYGVLALEFIAEQLHPREEQAHGMLDAVSVIEMNDTGSLIFDREPMDWILFNKLLDRQMQAKPRSHGNYYGSLAVAQDILHKELQLAEDIDQGLS